jgi:hypothetical protein
MWGHPPSSLRARKGQNPAPSGAIPLRRATKPSKSIKKRKTNRQNRQNIISTCLKTAGAPPGPLRGPSGAPPRPLRGPLIFGATGQVWPKIDRTPAQKSEFRIANGPLRGALPRPKRFLYQSPYRKSEQRWLSTMSHEHPRTGDPVRVDAYHSARACHRAETYLLLFFVSEVSYFGGLGGPGGPGGPSKRPSAAPKDVWKGFWGRRSRPDPQNRHSPI